MKTVFVGAGKQIENLGKKAKKTRCGKCVNCILQSGRSCLQVDLVICKMKTDKFSFA